MAKLIQVGLVACLTLAFFARASFARNDFQLALGMAAIVTAWLWGARRRGDPSVHVAGSGFVVMLLVFLGSLGSDPSEPSITSGRALTALLALLAAQGVFGLRHFGVVRPERTSWGFGLRARRFALIGTVCGVLTTALFGIPILGAVHSGELSIRSAIFLAAVYVVGGSLVGATAGVLRPLTRYPLGLMLVGMTLSALCYGAIGAYMAGTGYGGLAWSEVPVVTLIIAVTLGVVLAYIAPHVLPPIERAWEGAA